MPPPSDEAVKAAFRRCVETQCVPLVGQVATLNSAAQASVRYGLRRARDNSNTADLDPVKGAPAKRAQEVGADLRECEKECANVHWPEVAFKPWIGSVAIDMCGMPAAHFQAQKR
mmetsp:Transcript_342/g.744  ORF Transcript_342/g.744 Transcript_342/m.744 type:complete len:115 (-) Transcript_342:303-647(-)